MATHVIDASEHRVAQSFDITQNADGSWHVVDDVGHVQTMKAIFTTEEQVVLVLDLIARNWDAGYEQGRFERTRTGGQRP